MPRASRAFFVFGMSASPEGPTPPRFQRPSLAPCPEIGKSMRYTARGEEWALAPENSRLIYLRRCCRLENGSSLIRVGESYNAYFWRFSLSGCRKCAAHNRRTRPFVRGSSLAQRHGVCRVGNQLHNELVGQAHNGLTEPGHPALLHARLIRAVRLKAAHPSVGHLDDVGSQRTRDRDGRVFAKGKHLVEAVGVLDDGIKRGNGITGI